MHTRDDALARRAQPQRFLSGLALRAGRSVGPEFDFFTSFGAGEGSSEDDERKKEFHKDKRRHCIT